MSWDLANTDLEVNFISNRMFAEKWEHSPHRVFKDAVLWDWM